MATIKNLVENRPLYTVDKQTTALAASEYMAEHNIGALAVMDGPRLAGIFSERDVIGRVIAHGLDPAKTEVADVMTVNIVVATADQTDEDCLKKMKAARCRHLPVVENDQLIGMISLRDLLQVHISEKDDKIEFLQNYMFQIPPGLERKYGK